MIVAVLAGQGGALILVHTKLPGLKPVVLRVRNDRFFVLKGRDVSQEPVGIPFAGGILDSVRVLEREQRLTPELFGARELVQVCLGKANRKLLSDPVAVKVG